MTEVEPFPRAKRFRRDAKAEPPYEPSSTTTSVLAVAGYSARVRVTRGSDEWGWKEKRVTFRLTQDGTGYSHTATYHINVSEGDPPIQQDKIDDVWLAMLATSRDINLSDPKHKSRIDS